MGKIPKLLGILEYVLFLLVLSDPANLYCLELPVYLFKESWSPHIILGQECLMPYLC